jgi:cytidyltransferase-like protein
MDGTYYQQKYTKMKSFKQLIVEKNDESNPVVMAFGRMNPPTTGHLKLIHKVHDIADKEKAAHAVIVSHSQDSKKNPLSTQQKLKHLQRYSPETHFVGSSSNEPSLLHHASNLYKMGHKHLIMVAGSDRVKEYHDLLHKYNGVEGRHGHFNFKKIEVRSAGHRDPDAEGEEGMSGSKMRQHAKNNDFSSFRQGVPSHVSDHDARELMHDVRKGMNLHESHNRGLNKAIFVTGGPGSGKDIILRECIAEQGILEFNFTQLFDILADKHKLAMNGMKPKDLRVEAVRKHKPLIINGPADDFDKVSYIKEELEELGYQTMMVFVDTTEQVSKERNTLLSKMMLESVRHDKWAKAQANKEIYTQMFDNFVHFDNSENKELVTESLDNIFSVTTNFFDSNRPEGNIFLNLHELRKEGAKTIQKSNLKAKGKKFIKDNNAPFMQAQQKMGKIDDVRDGDVKSNSSYIFRTYAESKFQMDNDKEKRMKRGDRSLTGARVSTPDGVNSTYDSRGTTGAAGAGLAGGDVYREETSRGGTRDFNNDDVLKFSGQTGGPKPNPLGEKKTLKKFREAIDSPGSDMGVGGTLGGSTNKEPMVTPMDKFGQSGITIRKKKTGAK